LLPAGASLPLRSGGSNGEWSDETRPSLFLGTEPGFTGVNCISGGIFAFPGASPPLFFAKMSFYDDFLMLPAPD